MTSICEGDNVLPDFGGGMTWSRSLLNALEQLALAALAPDDDGLFRSQSAVFDVQSQLGLTRFLVRPVAGEAILREDRQNFAAEVDGRLSASSLQRAGHREAEYKGSLCQPANSQAARGAWRRKIEWRWIEVHAAARFFRGGIARREDRPFDYRSRLELGSIRNRRLSPNL